MTFLCLAFGHFFEFSREKNSRSLLKDTLSLGIGQLSRLAEKFYVHTFLRMAYLIEW